jgi:hypothetical protein
MPSDLVLVSIKGVMPTANGCAVFLGNDDKTFVIYVDHFVGNAIQMTLNGVRKERPLTHDLIGSILLGLGAELDHTVVNDAKRGHVLRPHPGCAWRTSSARRSSSSTPGPATPSSSRCSRSAPFYVARTVFEQVEDMTEILERVLKQQAEENDEVAKSRERPHPSRPRPRAPAGLLPGGP